MDFPRGKRTSHDGIYGDHCLRLSGTVGKHFLPKYDKNDVHRNKCGGGCQAGQNGQNGNGT